MESSANSAPKLRSKALQNIQKPSFVSPNVFDSIIEPVVSSLPAPVPSQPAPVLPRNTVPVLPVSLAVPASLAPPAPSCPPQDSLEETLEKLANLECKLKEKKQALDLKANENQREIERLQRETECYTFLLKDKFIAYESVRPISQREAYLQQQNEQFESLLKEIRGKIRGQNKLAKKQVEKKEKLIRVLGMLVEKSEREGM